MAGGTEMNNLIWSVGFEWASLVWWRRKHGSDTYLELRCLRSVIRSATPDERQQIGLQIQTELKRRYDNSR